MIRPNPFLKIDVAEKLASLLIPTPHAQSPNRFGESESLNQPNRDLLLQQPARGIARIRCEELDARSHGFGLLGTALCAVTVEIWQAGQRTHDNQWRAV